jgi:outer membrane protein assembly factor BamB
MKQLLLALVAVAGCSTPNEVRENFVVPVEVLQVRWSQHITEEPLIEYKPQEFASATSDGQRVWVGSSAGYFYAFDTRDGHILWRKKLAGGVIGRPRYVAQENTVFVGSMGGAVYSLDASTGEQHWAYELRGPVESQPVFQDGLLYFTSGENRIYALDAHSGKWKWQYDRESPESFTIRGYAGPLVTNGRVYVGFSDGYLACLSAATGDVAWARSLAGDATRFMDVDGTPTLANGTLYVSSFSGGVYALDPKDGSTRWRYDVEGAGTVRVRGGKIYFSAARMGIHCLDADGHLRWRQALAAGGELSAPLVVGGYVMVSTAAGGTYIADAVSGRLYQYFFPGHGVTAEPTTDGRQIYVLSNGGYFYALAFSGRRG